ncbi:hypothetical protein BO82DRAFT_96295 [Aspergillus uvarum CBS 121591]|uniref:Uncharacterized protein n=1 Tax=Aspergillus uvarum CBS 121591 TaxID=1448315 RepID=A0A319CAB3_9EURO|nr:hypothetical protein BO82DRAFT_96295 [Aspergillus uvarum CBS 121591]PYH81180.1 hypothetical protein BO82DRAFT_96295 [Aspergillus uvarum CBS 121591]
MTPQTTLLVTHRHVELGLVSVSVLELAMLGSGCQRPTERIGHGNRIVLLLQIADTDDEGLFMSVYMHLVTFILFFYSCARHIRDYARPE